MIKIRYLYRKIWYQGLMQKGSLYTDDEWALYLLFAFSVLTGGAILGFVTMLNYLFGIDIYSVFGIRNERILGSKIPVTLFSILLLFGFPFFLNYKIALKRKRYKKIIEEFSKDEINKKDKRLLITFVLFCVLYPLLFGFLNNYQNF